MVGQVSQLRRSAGHLGRRHAAGQVALGEAARGFAQASQRRREAPGQPRRDDDGEGQGEQGDCREQSGDVRNRARPKRVGIGQRDLDRERKEPAGSLDDGIGGDRLTRLAVDGLGREGHLEMAVG